MPGLVTCLWLHLLQTRTKVDLATEPTYRTSQFISVTGRAKPGQEDCPFRYRCSGPMIAACFIKSPSTPGDLERLPGGYR